MIAWLQAIIEISFVLAVGITLTGVVLWLLYIGTKSFLSNRSSGRYGKY